MSQMSRSDSLENAAPVVEIKHRGYSGPKLCSCSRWLNYSGFVEYEASWAERNSTVGGREAPSG